MKQEQEIIENIAKNVDYFISKEEKSTAKINEIEKQVNNIQNYLARPDMIENSIEEKSTMDGYIRKGIADGILTKSLGSAEGKIVVAPTLYKKIIGALREKSVMRSLASVQTISTNALDVVIENDNFISGWVEEEAPRGDTDNPKLTTLKIHVHELYAQPKATQRLIDDSAIDIQDWLVQRLSDSFALSENEAFITGDGDKKPFGIIMSNKIKKINCQYPGPTVELLLEIINNLPECFISRATFLMNRTTLSVIQSLQDKNSRFIWQQSLSDSLTQTIFGIPVVCTPHMPVIKDDTPAIVLGDIKEAYKIVDRSDINLLRDHYTEKPFVKFYATKRVGGALVNPKALVMSTFTTH